MDSSILADRLLRLGVEVAPLYMRCGFVWEQAELAALERFLMVAGQPAARPLVVLDAPLSDVYQDHWSVTGRRTPNRLSADADVCLPGRNLILVAKAVLWCQLHGLAHLALGPLASTPFADARRPFFDQFQRLVELSEGPQVRIWLPFADHTKRQVMELGAGAALQLTLSCIAPVGRIHCGRCNKCGERQRAFAEVGLPDPTDYTKA